MGRRPASGKTAVQVNSSQLEGFLLFFFFVVAEPVHQVQILHNFACRIARAAASDQRGKRHDNQERAGTTDDRFLKQHLPHFRRFRHFGPLYLVYQTPLAGVLYIRG